MTGKGGTAIKSGVIKIANTIGLTRLYGKFSPELRHVIQTDIAPFITGKELALHENRALVSTRDGPVGVKSKPSFVLTGVLVCMAGIATIFYLNLIGSYSFTKVGREETIKTVEASINSTDVPAASKLNTPAKPKFGNIPQPVIAQDRMPQGDVKQWSENRSVELDEMYLTGIEGKIAQPARPIVGRIMAKPVLLTPQTPQINTVPKNQKITSSSSQSVSDNMPMIIQGGKRITVESEAAIGMMADIKALPTPEVPLQNMNEAEENAEAVVNTAPYTELASASNLSQLVSPGEPDAPTMMNVARPSPILENSLSARAQEIAIALLPNFTSKPKKTEPVTIENNGALDDGKSDEAIHDRHMSRDFSDGLTQPLPPAEKANTVTAVPQYPQDDGLQSGFFANQQGPVIPLVTDATRTRKMLLSLKQEIDYIRATVTGLGIATEALPEPLPLDDSANDPTLKDVMINLAEHRGVLRKIPFKPPMLYFYISSDYGNRKHPKTGKVTFHHGVDLAGTWQENVRAAAPGTVIYAGTEGSFGKVVRIEHDFGVITTYAHLARITVKRGDYIGENHIIGKMGNTGKSAGAHLHYEIRINNKSIDPVKFMNVGRQISVAGELRQTSLIE